MASYSIVLNLSGNAIKRTQRLADTLARANTNAINLSKSLTAVGSSARSIPSAPINISQKDARAYSRGMGQRPETLMLQVANRFSVAANKISVAANKMSKAATQMSASSKRGARSAITNSKSAKSHAYQTRHRHTRIASMGTGFSIGGFSGRLSTILQPNENGKLFGVNAVSLMRSANVASIATSLVATVGKVVLKAIAYSTVAPVVVGGGGMMLAIRYLQSESFAEGVRLISRRHQAKLGLGSKEFLQAERNVDFLASSYGLDRSTTLSSINVLTGLGVGGSDRRLSLADATGLTKVGGLISQHHGVPFERVMTNIQQLLVQSTPHMRDIRELLNQAPILGKYALRDMDERKIKGVDVRDYLKEQANIFRVLKSYELDVATNAGMQSRGQMSLARQDFSAKVASADDFWRFIGRSGKSLIGTAGDAVVSFIESLSKNEAFRVMVRNIEAIFKNLGNNGTKVANTIIQFIQKAADRWGLDIGDTAESKLATSRVMATEGLKEDSIFRADVERFMKRLGMLDFVPDSAKDTAVSTTIDNVITNLLEDVDFMAKWTGVGRLYDANTNPYYTTIPSLLFGTHTYRQGGGVRRGMNRSIYRQAEESLEEVDNTYVFKPRTSEQAFNKMDWTDPAFTHVAQMIARTVLSESVRPILEKIKEVKPIDADSWSTQTGESGSDLTGFNRDRRALEIHFHDKIIEWNSQIVSDDKEEVMAEIETNLEQLVSAGLQKALLGSTGSARSRFM